jgi:hypothetical protein
MITYFGTSLHKITIRLKLIFYKHFMYNTLCLKGTLKESKLEKGIESFVVETDFLFLELHSIVCALRTMPVYFELPLLLQNTRIALYSGTPPCQYYSWDWLVLIKRMANSGLFQTCTQYLIFTANQNTEFVTQKRQAALCQVSVQ